MAREQAHPGTRSRGVLWTLALGVLLLVLFALLLIPLIDDMFGRDTPLSPLARRLPRVSANWLRGPGAGGPATVDDIAARPQAYVGKVVSVTGSVGQVLGRRAFTIGDGGFLDDGLLVVTNRPLRGAVGGSAGPTGAQAGQLVLTDREVVEVTGEIRRFDIEEIERELGLRLDEARFTDWTNRPVLLATAIGPGGRDEAAQRPAATATPADRPRAAREGDRARPGATQATPRPGTPVPGGRSATATATAADAVTVDDLAHDPDAFVGKTVTVTGEVGEVLGRRSHTAFTLEDEDFIADESVLVIGSRPTGREGELPLIEDDRVRVTGTVRRFDRAALERELGLTLSPDLYASWRGRPVIVLSAIDLTPALSRGS